MSGFDVAAVQRDFPLLRREVNGKRVKRLKLEEMTPLEALNYLAKLRDRVV